MRKKLVVSEFSTLADTNQFWASLELDERVNFEVLSVDGLITGGRVTWWLYY